MIYKSSSAVSKVIVTSEEKYCQITLSISKCLKRTHFLETGGLEKYKILKAELSEKSQDSSLRDQLRRDSMKSFIK